MFLMKTQSTVVGNAMTLEEAKKKKLDVLHYLDALCHLIESENTSPKHLQYISQIQNWLTHKNGPDLWEAAKILGAFKNDSIIFKNKDPQKFYEILTNHITLIREAMGDMARYKKDTTQVVLGTSGWRGKIGEDFTLLNVHKTVRGIIEMMKTETFLKENNFKDFEETKKAGIVVMRDNRYMGDEFIEAAMKELAAAGIKIHLAGQCPTGVGSTVVVELKAAGSINFTPSHNPMSDQGLKFNAADGGPAQESLTSIIEQKANAYMQDDSFVVANAEYESFVNRINPVEIYKGFLKKNGVFNIEQLKQKMLHHKDRLVLVIDNMHGASRGFMQELWGADFCKEMKIEFIHTEDDYSFHGIKPEPSEKTIVVSQTRANQIVKERAIKNPLVLSFVFDPDADRLRVADSQKTLDMNRFAAVAFWYMAVKKSIVGSLATTVASSGFAGAIAKKLNRTVREVAVGFKNFNPFLTKKEVVLAFEESDGISFKNHTLEKDGLPGILLAIEMCIDENKEISEIYESLREEFGYFNPGKTGIDMPGIKPEVWQKYKKAVVAALQDKAFVTTGESVKVGSHNKQIKEILTVDGLKVIFDDASWILMRPSGTEPQFRVYYETIGKNNQENEAYEDAAKALLEKARTQVGNP